MKTILFFILILFSSQSFACEQAKIFIECAKYAKDNSMLMECRVAAKSLCIK
jgi:hypothetical protein